LSSLNYTSAPGRLRSLFYRGSEGKGAKLDINVLKLRDDSSEAHQCVFFAFGGAT